MKILIADDTTANLLLLQRHFAAMGYEVITACNGAEAVAHYQQYHPDLVIMDVMMPELDGYEATRRIRRNDHERWVPILFLSALTDDNERTKGLEAGGDDYLAKPVNLFLLNNKIKALRRVADMQDQVTRYARELQANLEQNRDEQKLARHLLEHIIRQDKEELELVQSWVSPAQHFSGDVVMTARTPSNEMNILLADATGHGLSAAISVLPVIESFYSMTEKGFSLSSIVRELNQKVRQLLPIDRFVAAAVASIDFSNCTVAVWNGGAPQVIFVDDVGVIQRTWHSENPALGILKDNEFDSTPQHFHWEQPGELFLCSDGLLEAEDNTHEPFSTDRLKQLLQQPVERNRFQTIKNALNSHIQDAQQRDDISLVAIRCSARQQWRTATERNENAHSSPPLSRSHWRLSLVLGAGELRQLDALPLIMNWLDQLKIGSDHRGQAFLVLGELFNNALDHGVLQLDSKMKHSTEGFEQYISEREKRLAALTEGQIEIELERLRNDQEEHLRIKVHDSGTGFDFKNFLAKQSASDQEISGRGIMLVKRICLTLDYSNAGSQATAIYRLS